MGEMLKMLSRRPMAYSGSTLAYGMPLTYVTVCAHNSWGSVDRVRGGDDLMLRMSTTVTEHLKGGMLGKKGWHPQRDAECPGGGEGSEITWHHQGNSSQREIGMGRHECFSRFLCKTEGMC